jgi:hypothetical protein
MYHEEELGRQPYEEQEWWEQQLETEREHRRRLEKEIASWKQEEIKWRAKAKRWLVVTALLAIAVIGLAFIWGMTSAELSDARQENDHWEAVYLSGGLPEHFGSLQDLRTWLAKDKTDIKGGEVEHLTQGELDCDDYALTLQKHALQHGYIVSLRFVDTTGEGRLDHAMNTAVIGNKVYSIEPQTDRVAYLCELDELDYADYALTLQKHALEDGYILSLRFVDTDGDGSLDRAMNTAVTGNKVYSIEPQTDKVTLLCNLDD